MQYVYASSFGIAMVIAIFGGVLLGNWLDKKLGTGHKFLFLFVLIGIIAGFRNLYVWVQKTAEGSDDEVMILKYVKDEPHRKRPAVKKT